MKHFAGWDEQTLDLCVDRFTVGLDRDGELALGRRTERADLEEFERAVAAVHLGLLGEVEAPPAEFLERLERDGRDRVRSEASAARPSWRNVLPTRELAAWTGWLVAAGLLLMLLPLGGGQDGVLELRETLVAGATDLVSASWTTTEDAAAVGVSGDVLWSSARQEGVMRFQGLAPNDPAEEQYQLWIFDPTRADWEERPVDGGVFDVSSAGEVLIPIEAKLAVKETALFAITIEVPGGVVVSERERLVLTASP